MAAPPAPRPRRPSLPALALLGALSLLPEPALAQRAARPPAEAVEHFRRARDHYAAGRYRKAIEELRLARRADPDSPALAHNLARVHELLGELDEAIEMYRTYLRLLPEGERAERDRIRGVLVRLEGARGEIERHGERAAQPAPRPPPTPPRPLEQELGARYVERHVVDTPVWALLGTGAAGLLLGGVAGGVALARRSDVEGFVLGRDGSLQDREALDSERSGWALTADVSLGVGAAALLGAALMYLLRTETWERLPSGAERPLGGDEPEEAP